MDQQLAADAGSPDEALTVGNIAHPSESAAPHAAPGRNTLRQTLINLLPPIHLAAVIIFWIYAPKA